MTIARQVAVITLVCIFTLPASPQNVSSEVEQHIQHVTAGLIGNLVLKGQEHATRTLADRMKQLNVPGVSIAVIHNGKIEWARGFGVRNSEGAPVNAETLFQAGSISKPVAAMAALWLVQEGKMTLDEDINTYLTSWKLPSDPVAGGKLISLRELLTHTAGTTVHGVLLLPVGLHNMLSILKDLMEHRDYVYRQGSNTAVISIVENAPRGYFYAPGSKTAIFAGGTWRPILQSSNLAAFSPGDEHYVTSEDDGKTYRVKLGDDEKLTRSVFVDRGGTSVINDAADNVYIAGDQVYVYNRDGKQIGALETPERPGSLALGGPDNCTLFIGARSSLYAIRLASLGR